LIKVLVTESVANHMLQLKYKSVMLVSASVTKQ